MQEQYLELEKQVGKILKSAMVVTAILLSCKIFNGVKLHIQRFSFVNIFV